MADEHPQEADGLADEALMAELDQALDEGEHLVLKSSQDAFAWFAEPFASGFLSMLLAGLSIRSSVSALFLTCTFSDCTCNHHSQVFHVAGHHSMYFNMHRGTCHGTTAQLSMHQPISIRVA